LVAKNSHWLWSRLSSQWVSGWGRVGGPSPRVKRWNYSLTPICCRDLHTSIQCAHGERYLSRHNNLGDLECSINIVIAVLLLGFIVLQYT